MADERARNPYFAMPSDRLTKVLAIPNIILQSKAQIITPPAPIKNKEFLFKKASICNPKASRYLEKAEVTAVAGFSRSFFAKFPSTLFPKSEEPLKENCLTP
jgi:hypothetical protein